MFESCWVHSPTLRIRTQMALPWQPVRCSARRCRNPGVRERSDVGRRVADAVRTVDECERRNAEARHAGLTARDQIELLLAGHGGSQRLRPCRRAPARVRPWRPTRPEGREGLQQEPCQEGVAQEPAESGSVHRPPPVTTRRWERAILWRRRPGAGMSASARRHPGPVALTVASPALYGGYSATSEANLID
jgi:hypothetical protein